MYLNNQKKFETVESETETTYKNLDANQTTKYVKGEGNDLTIQFNGKNKIQYDYEEKLQSVTYNTNKISYNYLDDNVKSLTLNTTKLADWEYNENKLETEVNFGNQKSRIVTNYDKTNSHIDTETFLEAFAEDDAYWMKLYFLSGDRNGVFDVNRMNKMLAEIKKTNDEIFDSE